MWHRAEDNQAQGSAGVAGDPQKPGWKQESRGLFHTFKWGLVGGAGHTQPALSQVEGTSSITTQQATDKA